MVLDSSRWLRESGLTLAPTELEGRPEFVDLASRPAAEVMQPRYGLSRQEEFLRLGSVRPVFFPTRGQAMDVRERQAAAALRERELTLEEQNIQLQQYEILKNLHKYQ